VMTKDCFLLSCWYVRHFASEPIPSKAIIGVTLLSATGVSQYNIARVDSSKYEGRRSDCANLSRVKVTPRTAGNAPATVLDRRVFRHTKPVNKDGRLIRLD